MLFLHWEVPVEALKPLVHPRLSIDTHGGRAYIGVVAFSMRQVRPFRWWFSMPTATNFYELNVRTYVHLDGEQPGVWFLSLDANSTLATLAARSLWSVPYYRGNFEVLREEQRWHYPFKRSWPRPTPASFSARYQVHEALPESTDGSLQFFLAERYGFYSAGRGGALFHASVHHRPYALHRAGLEHSDDKLLSVCGVTQLGAPTDALFSPGVDVEIFSQRRVAKYSAPEVSGRSMRQRGRAEQKRGFFSPIEHFVE